ncbi:hypothetical protein MKX03_026744 [Papaver bracteatum]|nr:hypothetical protein MKX03_026744 [Papaver bracteatum]
MILIDVQTLWKLDRLKGNYKKMLIKVRKQSLPGGNQKYPAIGGKKLLTITGKLNIRMEEDVNVGEDIPTSNFPPVEIEKDGGYASGNKSGGSSASSNSDDSSSDSDSDSGSSSDSDYDGD